MKKKPARSWLIICFVATLFLLTLNFNQPEPEIRIASQESSTISLDGSTAIPLKSSILNRKSFSLHFLFKPQANPRYSNNPNAVILKTKSADFLIALNQQTNSQNALTFYSKKQASPIFDPPIRLNNNREWHELIVSRNNYFFFTKVTIYLDSIRVYKKVFFGAKPQEWFLGESDGKGFEGVIKDLKIESPYIDSSIIPSSPLFKTYTKIKRHPIEQILPTILAIMGAILLGIARFSRTKSQFLFALGTSAIYIALLTYLLNVYPYERYPNWDFFWADVRTGANLELLKQAISIGEIPFLSTYTNLGYNIIGDHYPILTIPNLLVILISPQSTMYVLQCLMFFIGWTGSFLFLKHITGRDSLSTIGGIYYISSIYILSNFLYFHVGTIFYCIPMTLYLIHKFIEGNNAKHLIVFFIFSFIFSSYGGLYEFVIMPSLILFYSLLVGKYYYIKKNRKNIFNSLILLTTFLASSSYYLLPLLSNIANISEASKSLASAIHITSQNTGIGIVDFIYFFLKYIALSLIAPYETSGGGLYAPFFLYLFIGIFLIKTRRESFSQRNAKVVVYSLLFIASLMFIESLAFYSTLTPSSIKGPASGILRYHLSALPFMVTLASFISLSGLFDRFNSIQTKRILLVTLLYSSIHELIFFVITPHCSDSSNFICIIKKIIPFQLESLPYINSSNLFKFDFLSGVLYLIPLVHIIAISSLFLLQTKFTERLKPITIIFITSSIQLFSLLIFNELRLQGRSISDVLSRDSYRIDVYNNRKSCINSLIDRSDPNYRTLVTGKSLFGSNHKGRSWNLIAETELNVTEKQNTLFSYREFDQPYVGLVYGLLTGLYKSTNLFPPLSDEVSANPDVLKAFGVKWVVSDGSVILNQVDYKYEGSCSTPEGIYERVYNKEFNPTMYVYSVKNANKIAKLFYSYDIEPLESSLNELSHPHNKFLRNNLISIEENPSLHIKSTGHKTQTNQDVDVTSIKINRVDLKANTNFNSILAISYVYSKNWKAYLNGKEVRILRANGGTMSIEMPAGSNKITLKYCDKYFLLGLEASIIFFFFLVSYICFKRKKKGGRTLECNTK